MSERSNLLVSFRWRDREGNFHLLNEMGTQHLFYVLRMIWNHSAPPRLRVDIYNFKRYRFGPFYTKEYMLDAIKYLSAELSTRKDLTMRLREQLHYMLNHVEQIPTIALSVKVMGELNG